MLLSPSNGEGNIRNPKNMSNVPARNPNRNTTSNAVLRQMAQFLEIECREPIPLIINADDTPDQVRLYNETAINTIAALQPLREFTEQ